MKLDVRWRSFCYRINSTKKKLFRFFRVCRAFYWKVLQHASVYWNYFIQDPENHINEEVKEVSLTHLSDTNYIAPLWLEYIPYYIFCWMAVPIILVKVLNFMTNTCWYCVLSLTQHVHLGIKICASVYLKTLLIIYNNLSKQCTCQVIWMKALKQQTSSEMGMLWIWTFGSGYRSG